MRLVRWFIHRVNVRRVRIGATAPADSTPKPNQWPIRDHVGGLSNTDMDAIIKAERERTRVRRR